MNNKKGYTLIEIIVTFMLISMFLLAATVITTSCMKVYLNVKVFPNWTDGSGFPDRKNKRRAFHARKKIQ